MLPRSQWSKSKPAKLKRDDRYATVIGEDAVDRAAEHHPVFWLL